MSVRDTTTFGGFEDRMNQIMQMGMLAGMSGGAGKKNPDMDAMLGMMFLSNLFGGGSNASVYDTQGRTVTPGGETFLIAYTLQKKQPNPMTLMAQAQQNPNKEPDFGQLLAAKRTSEGSLSLALLNLKTISRLTEIRPFDLNQELAEGDTGSILAPVFQQARENAVETSSISNLKQLALGVLMYSQDNNEKLPPMKDPSAPKKAIDPYVKNDELFVHPQTKEPYQPNVNLSRKSLAAISRPAETPLLYEASPGPDGMRAVAYVDGHVKKSRKPISRA
ncbi:MAG TPA: hypothetical protein VFB38_18975 [Chthonomonadaceae bacterium]|nr:hypothetical protein [Chthonomonadaceae bacterium]